MNAFDGYEVDEQISVSRTSQVYRGRRLSDGAPVCIKRKTPVQSNNVDVQYLQAYELACQVASTGVAPHLALVEDANGPALIMADVGRMTLTHLLGSGRIPLMRCLEIGITLADTLADIHTHSILHGGVSPSNVVIAADGSPRLIDFIGSCRVSYLNDSVRMTREATLDLRYAAPEQSGRTNRTIDTRADLYSFGVVLFELLTSVLPFTDRDPLALVHSHLAKRPPRVDAIESTTPRILSDLVDRLLEKDPDARYQSASGVAHDLKRLRLGLDSALGLTGVVLGERDHSTRFSLPQRLYGRESALSRLQLLLDRASRMDSSTVAVIGHAGIGKSALINELAASATSKGVRIVRGRFEPLGNDIPLAAFARALQDLVQQLVSERSGLPAVAEWLSANLGPEASALSVLVPQLRDHLPMEGSAMNEAIVRARRFNAVIGLLTCAAALGSIMLVLDDMQWADEAALALLTLMLGGAKVPGLCVVFAWREEEVSSAHPLTRAIAEAETELGQSIPRVALAPLTEKDVRLLIQEAFGLPEDEGFNLAHEVTVRTGGNPFFLHQYLLALHRDGQLLFDQNQRRWQLRLKHQNTPAPEGVVPFMLTRIQKLPAPSFALLRIAAHIGSESALEDLSAATELSASEVRAQLDPLLTEGFLLSRSGGERVEFLHDRVREAAWLGMSDADAVELHWRVGKGMLLRLSKEEVDERVVEVALHLARSQTRASDSALCSAIIELLLTASERAAASSAFATAGEFAQAARWLIGPQGWSNDRARCLRSVLLLAKVHNSQLDALALRELVASAEAAQCSPTEMLELYQIWLGASYAEGDLKGLTELGRSVLSHYGVDIPKTVGWRHVLMRLVKVRLLMTRGLPKSSSELSEQSHANDVAAVTLLRRLVPIAFRLSETLVSLYMIEVALRAWRCGRTPEAGFAWSTMGLLTVEVFDDATTANQLAVVGRELLETSDKRDMLAEVIVNHNTVIRPWLDHLKATVAPLDQAWQIALECGDSYLIGSIPAIVAFHRAFLGHNLGLLKSELAAYFEVLRRHGAGTADLRFLAQYIDGLTGKTPVLGELRGEHFDISKDLAAAQDQTSRAGATLHALMLAVFIGDTDHMAAALKLARPERKGDFHIFMRALWPHYAALAALASMPKGAASRHKVARDVRGWLRRLQHLSRNAPNNVEHRIAHVKAARAAAFGKPDEALRGFVAAASIARKHGWMHEAALAHEHAMQLLVTQNDLTSAVGHYQQAEQLYAAWGAERKLEQLRQNAPRALHGAGKTAYHPDAPEFATAESLDLETVTRALSAVSMQVELGPLVKTLLELAAENAGARAVTLVRLNNGVPQLEAEMRVGESEPVRLLHTVIQGEHGRLPESLIRVALLLDKPRVIDDVQTAKDLTAELAPLRARGARSLVLVPLIRKEAAVGVLTLENELSPAAFSPKGVRLLELLASQAAISLDNAVLHDTVQRSLRTQVQLTEANRRFVPQEFLASLGHESISSVELGQSVQKTMTVLFSDVRGFTTLVEGMSPEQNIAFINRYLSHMEPALLQHHGFVDSYIGDAIMALFDKRPDNALLAATDMLRRLCTLNTERLAEGQPQVKMGIGISTGMLTLGTIGGSNRLKCGVIGDCVNLAARIETATKHYGVPLLVGGDTVAEIALHNPFSLREVDHVRVVGKRLPVTLYEVFDADPSPLFDVKHATLPAWREGLDAYREGSFSIAYEILVDLKARLPDDPVLDIRLKRCRQYLTQPRLDSWEPVFELPSK